MYDIDFEVLSKASKVYLKIWGDSVDVSAQTKKAQRVTKEWQASLASLGYRTEVKISDIGNEKIDVLSASGNIAYELKVSGKNIDHELFKDIYKIMTYNLHHQRDTITDLVFISEHKAINRMESRLDKKYLKLLKESHRLNVYLFPLFPERAISNLMVYPPDSWGLRGDPYLWLDLLKKLSFKTIPNSAEELIQILNKQINELIGEKMEIGKDYFVEVYNNGGMSGGMISGEFWINKGIPYILSKFESYIKGKSH